MVKPEDTSLPDHTAIGSRHIDKIPASGFNLWRSAAESHGKSGVPSADLSSNARIYHRRKRQTRLKNCSAPLMAHELRSTDLLTCKSWPALPGSTSGATWVTRSLFFCATVNALFQRHHPRDQIRHGLRIKILLKPFRHQRSTGVSQNFEFRSQQCRFLRFGSPQCQAAGRL